MHPLRSLALAVAACTLAAGPSLAADPVRLDKAALEQLLPGRSINYTNPNGSSVHVTFGRDGRLTYKTGGLRDSIGTWSVGEDGRYCAKMTTGAAQDHCRGVYKTDTGHALRNATGEFIKVSGLD